MMMTYEYGAPPDWMLLEAVIKTSSGHDNQPSTEVISNYISRTYNKTYHWEDLKDKLDLMASGGIFIRWPGNYYISPQWGIHPDYYPPEGLRDPYSEQEREFLRDELLQREIRAQERKEAKREYDRARYRHAVKMRKRAQMRPSPEEIDKIHDRPRKWIECPEVVAMIDDDPTSVIIIDTETTGLSSSDDDVLELSIINGSGKTILSKRYGSWLDRWPEAERIHFIKPEDVKDLPTLETDCASISHILRNARIIAGYNVWFDLWFLIHAGVKIPNVPICDVMEEFSIVYGEWCDWIDYDGGYKWQTLTTAARYYKIDHTGAHGSLRDCLMTLGVMQHIAREPESKRHRKDPREE